MNVNVNAAFTPLSCEIPHRSHTYSRSDNRNALYFIHEIMAKFETRVEPAHLNKDAAMLFRFRGELVY